MTAPTIHRRSFARACTAIALGGQRTPDILRANWRDDTNAERVLRAVERRSAATALAISRSLAENGNGPFGNRLTDSAHANLYGRPSEGSPNEHTTAKT
jgi:hypothetical protein